jgi:hypothetical protein
MATLEEQKAFEFEYMMLDRLRMDCEYFLNYGRRHEKVLWAGNVKDQITEMKRLYNLLPEKPEWLALSQIEKYAKDMA